MEMPRHVPPSGGGERSLLCDPGSELRKREKKGEYNKWDGKQMYLLLLSSVAVRCTMYHRSFIFFLIFSIYGTATAAASIAVVGLSCMVTVPQQLVP